ncbi:MAG: C2 family cysteine protease [Myxococcaceae bacterium]|jgi:hypothetical protein|nr:C2 family cysteine protease [Myxococcaceae bacterium]
MPVSLNDRRLASLYASLERRHGRDPSAVVGRDQALELLAEVADRPGKPAAAMLAELRTPGLSEAQQVELARKGLTSEERADLKAILSRGDVPLAPAARQFLEAVLGGAPVAKDASLDVMTTATGVRGTTRPGATIEAVNVSAAAGSGHDVFAVGAADDAGRFSARLSGPQRPRPGDFVKLRARFDDGTTSDWVTVRADGRDERAAGLLVNRLELSTTSSGRVAVTSRDDEAHLSEPGARLQFINVRTGATEQVTLDAQGRLPKDFALAGKAGDRFSIAVTDGAHNRTFREVAGFVTVAGGARAGGLVPTPGLHKDELNADGTPKMKAVTYTGPLFRDGVSMHDVQQGSLANCYFPAAVAALAHLRPELIQRLIRDNGDGTFTVTFTQRDWATGRTKKVPVTVDSDLWTKPDKGTAAYGRGGTDHTPASMELWYPLLEKAYAQWKGSYDVVGNGGVASDVFEELTGEAGDYYDLHARTNPDTLWQRITQAIDEKRPVAAGTHEEKGPVHYTNTGVFGDHAYSIIGYQTEGTRRFLLMRNPWGDSEPRNNGPDDGVFKLELGRFMELFANVMTTSPE